jgi:hypothetical protein
MNYIYLIADTEHRWVKIGVSNDPFRRLRELNSGQAPFPLELLACFATSPRPDAYVVEGFIHKLLKAKGLHSHGEWFKYEAVVWTLNAAVNVYFRNEQWNKLTPEQQKQHFAITAGASA